MENATIISIILYVIIAMILIFALKSERADLNCADVGQTICGPGKGRAYYNSHPVKGDSQELLIKKLVRTANYDLIAIHWRRAMIAAIIIGFSSAFISKAKLPNGQILSIHVLIAFCVIYAFDMNYQSYVVKPAMKQVDEIARHLM